MRGKTACFTGHRKIPPESIPELSQRLKNTLLRLIEEGYMYFGAGGALGFDTLAAQCVLSLRKRYSHIKLILVLPCTTQTKGWSKDDIAVYEEIKSQADKVVYTSHDYFRGCMFKRNRHLVNGSSVCIAYLTQEKGGDCIYGKLCSAKQCASDKLSCSIDVKNGKIEKSSSPNGKYT